MHLRFVLLPFFLLLSATLSAQADFGAAEPIGGEWRFTLSEPADAQAPDCNEASWQRVTVPHDWSIHLPLDPTLASCTGFLPGGIGWYRKSLTIPRRAGGEKIFLYFDGVYNRSEVYFNGKLLGKRPNGYVSFYYDATALVRFDQENVIAVRVDRSRSADSRWYTGSGIYRKVYLIRSGAVHLAPWGVFARTTQTDAGKVQLSVTTTLQNETLQSRRLLVRHRLLSRGGEVAAAEENQVSIAAMGSSDVPVSIAAGALRRWGVDDPYLYSLETTVLEGAVEVDRALTPVGIRSMRFAADTGFTLNEAPLKLKGVCLHHDAGALGAVVPRIVWEKRIRKLKLLGCNAVRMSHNPQVPEVYALCDELGMLVMDEAFDEWEFPKRKWLKGWNVGEPGFEGSTDFFAEWSDRDLADQVRRNRNHPSIFAWSIGNEVDYPNDPYSHPVLDTARIDQPMLPGYKPEQPDAKRLGAIAKRLAAVVRAHDDSRPVTAALAGVIMSNETEYPAALDIVGYNYTEDRYAIDHQNYPARVIYGSENRHNIEAWNSVRDNKHIAGQFLWTGIDYLGEAGPWPARGSGSGLLDLTGAVKARGHFRAALWSERPVLYLGTAPAHPARERSSEGLPLWNYAPAEKVRVLAYTNAKSVRLTLNGRAIGDEVSVDDRLRTVSWELPFEAGELVAVSHDAHGAETGRAVLRSSGDAAALEVSTEEKEVQAARGVAVVSVQVLDASGVPVLVSERDLTCTVTGPVRLLALESGNLRDVSAYSDSVQSTYRGHLVAYVEATGESGTAEVKFSTAGLPEEVASIRVVPAPSR